MFKKTGRHFSPATVIATVALVFAMSGGAYAAGKYLITSTKQVSPKVLKSLKGQHGKNGAAGPQGPQGPQGASGSQGPAGPAGAKGETGPEGKEGKEGKQGTAGAKGSPWTAGGTLPSKATETGAWSFGYVPPGSPTTFYRIPISFPIPLVQGLSGTGCETVEPSPQPHVAETCQVHFINAAKKEVVQTGAEVTSTACTGSAASPTAAVGNLCVYTAALVEAKSANGEIDSAGEAGETEGTASAGAYIKLREASEESQGWGTWAVTAE